MSRALIFYGKENNLSQYELYAFLYDFAPKYIGGKDSYIIKDLPEPHSAYFIGASESDRFDPFFFYYRCVYISSPVGIKPFSLAEIKKDPVFKELPIVRKNMQGINGVELKPSVYNYLVKKSGAHEYTRIC